MTSPDSRPPLPDERGSTLLLAFNFPPHGGGIARLMGELALRYPPRSLIVSTGRHAGSATSDTRFPHEIDHVGIRATRLRTIHGLALWTGRASSLVRRGRPGFAWCAELKPAGYPACWLRARHGLPYGVFVYGTELLLLHAKVRRSAFKRWTGRQLLGGAGVVVAISRWTAGLARSVLESVGCAALARDVRVVPLGTTPSHFRPGIDPRPVRDRYGLDGGPWLLTVARLEWHKGIDAVIRALPAVRAAFPGARYAVAGVGPRRPQLERLVADLGQGDAVRFLGFVPDDELPALYNAADVYVGASRRVELLAEGFGLAIVEASACGLAVVGGRSGGVPDAVREGETGILVEPGDPAAVAAGITRLLADDELRRGMGAAGRRAVETHYNWDRVARDLIRIDDEFRRKLRPAER
ncbi:MAG TPA: glycosyltransferase family 4 protein [Gemmatimonadales bacterium]|nr:glycosyltransferase family 4 protein [Gemmatimonadales bacterium]HYT84228.1 glycosyltransferase family 4 protein [Gemmatimonadales bacterium]